MIDRRLGTKVLALSLTIAGCTAAALPPASESPPVAATAPAPTAPVASPEPAPEPAPAPAPEPEVAAPTPPAEQPAPGSPGAMLMREHFTETVAIREAVITGNLAKAVRPAATLAAMKGVETLPKLWQISAEQLRSSSVRIREGSDLQELAAATADIGRACGHCHGAVGGPTIEIGSPPEAGASVAARMKRHKWATDRLWEGIYGPSTAAWKAGAEALTLDPFPKELLDKGGVHARSAASRFNEDAKKLGGAKSSAERGAAYAELLSTCSPCHEALRVGR